MFKTKPTHTSKVLPFEGSQGHVQGHEVRVSSGVKHIVFKVWNEQAQMMLDTLVHWTCVSQYTKRMWPYGGSVEGAILEDGTRVSAKSWSVAHYDNEAYKAAPILCRDTFKITSPSTGATLWEIVGVDQWASSKRTDADTAKHLACPWERDNAAFRSRFQVEV